MASTAGTQVKHIDVDKVNIFYREAGQENDKTVLLLHGFPSSSHQYRHLIPRLTSEGYHVIAPDLPGFGFTTVPSDYTYTFDNISKTIERFIDTLGLNSFAMYVFDYGAPTGFRIAVRRPELVKAIVSQNGNAFEEGLGDAWAGIRTYWTSGSEADRAALHPILELDMIKWQYTTGEARPQDVPPESYSLDKYTLDLHGRETQLDLFYDYRTNVQQYPTWQTYLQKNQPALLAIWGDGDPFFIPAGAKKFKDVVSDAEVVLIKGGHFALELHLEEIAKKLTEFLKKVKW